MAVKFDPAAYQQSVNDYLAAMGVNVAPTEQYQTSATPQGLNASNLATSLAGAGAKKGLASLLGGSSAAAAPEGLTAVGTAANGTTMYAPTSSFLGAGSALPGGVGLGGIAAGAVVGGLQAKGALDALKGKKISLPSQAALVPLTGGLSLAYNPLKKLWDKDSWRGEQTRRGKLAEAGVTGWDQLNAATPQLKKGRSIAELLNPNYANDFQGMTKDAGFVNNKFAGSRNEGDLRPEDIWGYSAFGEKFGNDWLGKFTEDQRRKIAQTALDAGAVKEAKGSVNINFNPELDKKIQELVKPTKKK
jgi:hypothetical protein